MYLIDSNVWLERLLDQERSDEVGRFLDRVTSDHLFITDFAFHSIAVIMTRLKQINAFLQFVQDTFINGSVSLIHLSPEDSHSIIQIMTKYNMDFDDAYQYVAAEKHKLIIISFDSDFDRTDLGKKYPMEIINVV
jgi:predicted nucleic acid-binding protein